MPENNRFIYGLSTLDAVNPLVIVEGYKACLYLRQLGYNSVALQGVYCTKGQLKQLQYLSTVIYIFLDFEPGKQFPDHKGRCAAERNLSRLQTVGPSFIVPYPEGVSEGTAPDDLNPAQVEWCMKTTGEPTPTCWRRSI